MVKTLNNHIKAEIGRNLRENGFWVGQLLSPELNESLLVDAQTYHHQHKFKKAAIGSQHNKLISDSIRGDETCWIEGESLTQQTFMAFMLELKNVFESHFPIPLNNFDGHYSYYPSGTFYRKHWDNARQSNHRMFSVVNYLNPEWQPGDGGELVLFNPENDAELIHIHPTFGNTAIFFSTDFPHEVTETYKPRYSLTGWFHQRT